MLTAAGVAFLVAMSGRLKADPVDIAGVMANESGVKTTAHNPHGDASGLLQLMPATARALGWDVDADPHLERFRQLSDVDQLKWFERFLQPHAGQLVSPGAVYTAVFLPSLVAHASDPDFKLCGRDGPLAWAYVANKGFDLTGKGCITVQDLTDAIDRATARLPGWLALVAEIRQAQMPPSPLADTELPCPGSDGAA